MTDGSVLGKAEVDSITTTLLEEAQAGDERAWARLVEVYLPLVYWWCKQQGLTDADVLDVGQDVLLALSQHLGQFRRDRDGDTFRGWLRQITRNAVRDHYRRWRKQPQGEGGSAAKQWLGNWPAPDAQEDAACLETEVRILHSRVVTLIKGEFSERDWQAFYRVAVEDRSPREVAEELGISRNQVYLARSRIRKRLREEFGWSRGE